MDRHFVSTRGRREAQYTRVKQTLQKNGETGGGFLVHR